MTPVASAAWGQALVDGRAPTAMAELAAQDRAAAAASVVWEPAAAPPEETLGLPGPNALPPLE